MFYHVSEKERLASLLGSFSAEIVNAYKSGDPDYYFKVWNGLKNLNEMGILSDEVLDTCWKLLTALAYAEDELDTDAVLLTAFAIVMNID